MEELFPSEIARLVLGYLKESKCEKSWKMFLEESSDLQEYYQLYKKGKFYSTKVNGKSLFDILNEYCVLRSGTVNKKNSSELLSGTFKEKCKAALEEIVTNAVENVLKKYLPPTCSDVAIQDSEFREEVSNDLENEAEKSSNNQVLAIEYNPTAVRSQSPESNMETNVADSSTNIFCEPSMDQDVELIESPLCDIVFLQDIVKVEKEDSNSDSENFPEINASEISSSQDGLVGSSCTNNLLSKDSINAVSKDSVITCSTSGYVEKNANKSLELVPEKVNIEPEVLKKTIKLEPDSSASCSSTDSNSIQNNTAFQFKNSIPHEVKVSDPDATQIISNPVDNLGSFILTNQSGFPQQPLLLSSQPLAVNNMPFPSISPYFVPSYVSSGSSLQNNPPYSFIFNNPSAWSASTMGGFPLNLPNNPSTGPVLTSVETIRQIDSLSLPKISENNEISPAGKSQKVASNSILIASATGSGQTHIVSNVPSSSSSCGNNAFNTLQNYQISEENATLRGGKKSTSKEVHAYATELLQKSEIKKPEQKNCKKSKDKKTSKQQSKRKPSQNCTSLPENVKKSIISFGLSGPSIRPIISKRTGS